MPDPTQPTNASNDLPPGDGVPAPRRHDGTLLPIVSASRILKSTHDAWTGAFGSAGATQLVPPPYDPWTLVCMVEESDVLPACIDAMAVNVSGFGLRIELAEHVGTDPERREAAMAAPEAVQERQELDLFLLSCNVDAGGLCGVIDLVDRDVETLGYGFFEVLRDESGQVAGIEHIPAYTVRLGQMGPPRLVDVPFRDPVSGQLVRLPRWRRFRPAAQLADGTGEVRWFKAFGDERNINRKTGALQVASWGSDSDGSSLDGSEIVMRRIYAPHTPYGVPRWIGASPAIRASRGAGELIVDWFDNAPIGAKLAMIAGGTWKSDSLKAALEKMNRMVRGVENAWSLITLEADTGPARDALDDTRDQPARMMLEDLAYELQTEIFAGDASLLSTATERIRRQFRLAPVYLGDSADYNRATVVAAKAATEEQVMLPVRDRRWHSWLNGELLPAMGINYWRVCLNGANTTDDEALLSGLGSADQAGGLSVNAARSILAGMTGQPLDPIDAAWADRPMSLVLAMIQAGMDPNEDLSVAAKAAQEALQAQQAERAAAPGAPGGKGPVGKPAGPGASEQATKAAALRIVRDAALELAVDLAAGADG